VLSPGEWAEAEKVAARLATELSRLIGALPEHARAASAMARHLVVLRSTCQRITQAVQGPVGAAMLARLPGVQGLRQWVGAHRRVGTKKADIQSALSAVESFEALIELVGGSQAKLVARLEMGAPGRGASEGAAASLPQRRALYDAAVGVTGRHCDVTLSIYAFRGSPTDPLMLEHAMAKGLIGSVAAPGGMPIVLGSGNTLAEAHDPAVTTLDREVALHGRTPEAILKAFTSDPLPMVTSRSTAGTLFQVIDERSAGESFDVVTALRGRAPLTDPATGKPTLDSVWSLVKCPTERTVRPSGWCWMSICTRTWSGAIAPAPTACCGRRTWRSPRIGAGSCAYRAGRSCSCWGAGWAARGASRTRGMPS
jgi:hypothetical protein